MDARIVLVAPAFAAAAAVAFDHHHAAGGGRLERHVVVLEDGKASRVRYAGLDGWTRAEQMAFLINAYNAFMVEKILQRYPEIRSRMNSFRCSGARRASTGSSMKRCARTIATRVSITP